MCAILTADALKLAIAGSSGQLPLPAALAADARAKAAVRTSSTAEVILLWSNWDFPASPWLLSFLSAPIRVDTAASANCSDTKRLRSWVPPVNN